MKESTKEKVMQLQLMEQKMQNLLMQKQTFQAQLIEVENAFSELNEGNGEVYKIIGNVMVASKRDLLKKDLANRKEIIELRLKNIEKQEEKIKSESTKLQEEVMEEMKK